MLLIPLVNRLCCC